MEIPTMTDQTLASGLAHDPELDLVLVRDLKAPRARLWRAWTDPELLVQWWAPRPWRTEVIELDVRPMGGFRLAMLGPDGERFDGPGSFLHVEPGRALVWTSALGTGWRPAPDDGMPITVTITFEDHGGGSRYTAHVLHADPDARRRHEEMGFHDGWGTCARQLDELALTLDD